MEDKTFDLLTRMYSDFSARFDRAETDIGNIKNDIQGLKNDVIRIENDHGRKLEALLDGYKQTYEKLEVIEDKVDELGEKVDRHDIKIQVIEGARK